MLGFTVLNQEQNTVSVNSNTNDVTGTVAGESMVRDGSILTPQVIDSTGEVILPFLRKSYFGLVNLNDYMVLSPSDLRAIRDGIALAEAGFPSSEGKNPYHIMNNAILREFDPEKIVEFDKGRYVNALGERFNGTLRTYGITVAKLRPKIIGYVVYPNEKIEVPRFENKITYPSGSASVRAGKTQLASKIAIVVEPIYSPYEFDMDYSVSSINEHEAAWLHQDVKVGEYGVEMLALLRAASLDASFNLLILENANRLYREGIVHNVTSKFGSGLLGGNTANSWFRRIDALRTSSSNGLSFTALASDALPDPIRVGYPGWHYAFPQQPDPTIGTLASWTAAAFDLVDKPTILNAGPETAGMPTYGWQAVSTPKIVASKEWNTAHMQAAYYPLNIVLPMPLPTAERQWIYMTTDEYEQLFSAVKTPVSDVGYFAVEHGHGINKSGAFVVSPYLPNKEIGEIINGSGIINMLVME